MFYEAHPPTSDNSQTIFAQLSAGPAQALHRCVEGLRRGDHIVLVTGAMRRERCALLDGIGTMFGRNCRGITRLQGATAPIDFLKSAHDLGFSGPGQHWLAAERNEEQGSDDRHLIVVDDAELLSNEILLELASLRRADDGSMVQLVLSGIPMILARMCDPQCASVWRWINLAITLESKPAGRPGCLADLTRLRAEIARTEAKLLAQRRILEIFSSDLNDCQQIDQRRAAA